MRSRTPSRCRAISVDVVDTWRSANVLALAPDIRGDYERKVSAIRQYAVGAPLSTIQASTGIGRQHLYYLISRCEMADEDGLPYGFLALIKGKTLATTRRINPEILVAGVPKSGALQGLFARYPILQSIMHDLIVHGRLPGTRRSDRRITWAMIEETFHQECEKLGRKPPDYPFCSDSQGRVALRRWGRMQRAAAALRLGRALAPNAYDVLQGGARPTPSRCYERAECDGHFVDVNWTIEAPSLNGDGVIHIKVSRLWLIAILEPVSTAVLGYSVALGMNYSAADVARAVRSSLVPWTPRKLSVSTISYKPGECLPNAFDPALSFVCYDELWLDNAKSHLSDLFLSMLERTVNAVPVLGPRAAPNVRPHIEAVFDLLEEAGIHTVVGTTGSHPNDTRRSTKTEDQDLLSLELLLDLIDLLVVRYNTGVAPGTSISRLEVLRRAVNREIGIFRRLPTARREACLKYDVYEVGTIGQERGNPILRWRNARYRGPGLLSRAGLIGKEVLIMAASMDLRLVEVTLIGDGTSLGLLSVERRWRNTAHSLWTRRQARKEMTYSNFLRHAADIPCAFRQHVEQLHKKGRKHARQLARLVVEQREQSEIADGAASGTVVQTESSANKGANQSDVGPQLEVGAGTRDIGTDYLDGIIKGLGTVFRSGSR